MFYGAYVKFLWNCMLIRVMLSLVIYKISVGIFGECMLRLKVATLG